MSMTDNDKKVLRTLIIALAAVATALIAGVTLQDVVATGTENIPECGPYEVLVGQGDYFDGKWDRYGCRPVTAPSLLTGTVTPEEGATP